MIVRTLASPGLVLLLAACLSAPRSTTPPALVDVRVVRAGDTWTADFDFARDEPVWFFDRSALTRRGGKPWREESWRVLTPGVRLVRRDDKDVLVATNNGPVPRRVRVEFEPLGVDLQADYDAALVMTDGSVALFAGAFAAEPLGAIAKPSGEPDVRVSFRDRRGKVLHRGVRSSSATLTGAAMDYVLFGPARSVETAQLSTVIDPGVPAWFRDELLAFTPRASAFYADRLGPPGGAGKPTIMASWAGPTPKMISTGGSVLPGLITMRLEGVGLLTRNANALTRTRWFIAHEAAHFWLGETVSQESTAEAWIDEGGASLLAYRLMEQLDPATPVNYFEEWTDCLRLAKDQPINTAWRRQAHRAYYACGVMFGMVAERVAMRKGGSFFTFWRSLIDANRGGDGLVTRAEWLSEVTRLSSDPSLAADMDRIIRVGVPEPEKLFRDLFARAGVPAPPPAKPSGT